MPGIILRTENNASWLKDSFYPHGGYIIMERDRQQMNNSLYIRT